MTIHLSLGLKFNAFLYIVYAYAMYYMYFCSTLLRHNIYSDKYTCMLFVQTQNPSDLCNTILPSTHHRGKKAISIQSLVEKIVLLDI